MIVKKLLYIHLKLLLYRFYTGELWSAWNIVAADNKDYLEKHKKECEDIIRGIPIEYRVNVLKFLEMKAAYLQRKSTSRLNKKDREWIDARLFQTILMHAQVGVVEDIDRLEKEKKMLQEQKLLRKKR